MARSTRVLYDNEMTHLQQAGRSFSVFYFGPGMSAAVVLDGHGIVGIAELGPRGQIIATRDVGTIGVVDERAISEVARLGNFGR